MTDLAPTMQDARDLDSRDPLAKFRERFFLPYENGLADIYFVGNSLGLQPRNVGDHIQRELDTWRQLGVRGHFSSPRPWLSYHQLLTETMADIVGGTNTEVIVMNTLTVNLHLMMATFYQPTDSRHQILVESHAFPSDKNAAQSQIRLHGFNPTESLVEITPDDGQLFSTAGIVDSIKRHRDTLAMILLPGVQYYSGQVFDIAAITRTAQEFEIPIGFDLAHAAGNVDLQLHDWGVDFACWCTYKYLNAGPGSIAGCFIHQRHATDVQLPRMAGWWGHDQASRFEMTGEFNPTPTAEGWQLSNPPILSAAAVAASLDVFKQAGGMNSLVQKSKRQQQFFRDCLQRNLGDRVQAIAPADQSGCQLSLEVNSGGRPGKDVYHQLESLGVRTDWREPNVIRAAPVPLYNTFAEIYDFVQRLSSVLDA